MLLSRKVFSFKYSQISTSSQRYFTSSTFQKVDTPALIDATSLHDQLSKKSSKLKIVDATWELKPRNFYEEDFLKERIPNSVYFDIDKIADTSTNLPHMLPTPAKFEKAVQELGINNDDKIVVYDRSGMFVASARVWWTFQIFGHSNVSVLEGGLEEWKDKSYPTEKGKVSHHSISRGNFKAHFIPELVQTFEQMLENVKLKRIILDARPPGRFNGVDPEPRPGLIGGHMPSAINVPALSVLTNPPNKSYRHFLSKPELEQLFSKIGISKSKSNSDVISTTCGSGVTASIVALALYQIGIRNFAVYDGSWSEWGLPSKNSPIVTKN